MNSKALSYQQMLIDNESSLLDNGSDKYSGTFSKNMSKEIHGWFRYSAGFSSDWVNNQLQKEKKKGRMNVLDPFAGSGTVLIESEKCGLISKGVESHPFIFRVAKAKLQWREDPYKLKFFANRILENSKKLKPKINDYPELIRKCYPKDILENLDILHQSFLLLNDNSQISELTWLALASILRECSPVGTAQWTYILPNKSKAKLIHPETAFISKIQMMAKDMTYMKRYSDNSKAMIYNEDARKCESIPDHWADIVITSPPYANNYDYADATRLEMCFFKEISGWSDLQDSVRKHLIRSCTQHVSSIKKDTYNLIRDPLLKPIYDEIFDVCINLDKEKDNHGGKKNYHTMIAAYFLDLAKVWQSLRRITSDNANICFVIGDSAPYGIYVPVDRWLGELALNAGFDTYQFEKIRDRNVKWKNRKHTVPLHEGRLWVS